MIEITLQRTKRLIDKMNSRNLDAIIITDSENMHYYSGFYKGEGYLVIRRDKCYVVTDFRYTEYAEKNCVGYEVADIRKNSIDYFVDKDEVCGFEDMTISYVKYNDFAQKLRNLVPIGNMTSEMREIKDSGETELIKQAAKIADKAFEYICGFIRAGMTEFEIACELEHYMKSCGAEKTSFDTIVASGARASLPHAIPTENKLAEGELVVMDYGCMVGGYCSDMTRTVGVGKIDAELMEVYNTVLSAQLAALDEIKAGVSGAYVDNSARALLDMKYPGRFGHSLGHSVGLEIHESPNLSAGNNAPLCAGNIVTVEPGIYIPGKCGVRIEDLVLVTENGCEILSKSPKNLIIVG